MLIGCARVSTTDQYLTLQIEALTKAGCKRLFTDKASGAKTDRPGLTQALHFARAGDTLMIWKLDRLGRSIRGFALRYSAFWKLVAHSGRRDRGWMDGLSALQARILADSVEEGAAINFMAPMSFKDAARFWLDDVLPEVAAGRRVMFGAKRGGEIIGTVQLLTAMPPN